MTQLCKNHPTKVATGRCKRCNKPLCNDCKMPTDSGIYCSTECYEAVREFHNKVSDNTPSTARRSFFKKTLKGAVILIILLAVLFGIMKVMYGVSSFSGIIDVFRGWISYFLRLL